MIIHGINTSDISFVVQGAIDKKNTPLCLKSIRNNFPGSKIILSTWDDANVHGLDYDDLVLSKDPGAVVYSLDGALNNINRQIVSSQAGLSLVKSMYTAKVRSDLIFESCYFLNFFDRFSKYDEEYKRVKSRMICLSLYTRSVNTNMYEHLVTPNSFCPSDWFIFGYSIDVKKYFSVPLINDLGAFSRYYLARPHERQKLVYPTLMSRMGAEQYLGVNYFEKASEYPDMLSLERCDHVEGKNYLVNNFIVLDHEFSHIYSGKFESISKDEWCMPFGGAVDLVFFGDFLRWYKRYCDSGFEIPKRIDKSIYRRKLTVLWNILWLDKAKQYKAKLLRDIKNRLTPAKKIMRRVLPSYRASCGTREEILSLKYTEEHFNTLLTKYEELIQAQQSAKAEARMIRQELSEAVGNKHETRNGNI